MITKKMLYLKDRISDYLAKRIVSPTNVFIKQVKINNYQILIFANETVGRQIWWNKSYEKEETFFLQKFIKTDDICFDIGANIGYFTFLMANKAKNGVIHSFEPNPFCFHLLNSSKHLNCFDHIISNEMAVGMEDSNVTFNIATDSAFSNVETTDSLPMLKKVSVHQITIDSYVENNKLEKIDIMKIDVEGSEIGVILGAIKTLKSKEKRPKLIMLEVSIDNQGIIEENSMKVLSLLIGNDYVPKILHDGQLIEFNLDKPINTYNIFLCQNDIRFGVS